jgi:hypothetical protein
MSTAPLRGSRRSVFLAHTQGTETRAATHTRTPGAATHKHAPTQHRLWPATRAHMSITRHMDNMVGLVRCGAFRARPVANAQRTGALRPPPVIANATTALRESNVPIRPVFPHHFSLSLSRPASPRPPSPKVACRAPLFSAPGLPAPPCVYGDSTWSCRSPGRGPSTSRPRRPSWTCAWRTRRPGPCRSCPPGNTCCSRWRRQARTRRRRAAWRASR